jgi:hypothetical protein
MGLAQGTPLKGKKPLDAGLADGSDGREVVRDSKRE